MEQKKKITIKAVHNGDIRRIAIDDNLGFKDLKKLLKKLFKPAYSFNISYQDEENDLINIKSDLDLQTAVLHSRKDMLRITMEATQDSLVLSSNMTNDNIDESRNESSELSNSRIPLLGRRDEVPIRHSTNEITSDFQSQVEDLVMQTVTSKPVLDAIAQALLPQIIQALRETPSSAESIATTNNSNKEFGLRSLLNMEPILTQTGQTIAKSLSESTTSSSLTSSIPQNEVQEEQALEDTDTLTAPDNQLSNESSESLVSSSLKETQEDTKEDEKEDQIEPFVIVDKTASSKPKSDSNSALRSLLALFKISPRNRRVDSEPTDNNNNANNEEETVEIPNLEETLSQLADMGFSDRDANVKLLRFHKKYNEGVDEVIEDLLLQMQERLKAHANLTEEVRN